MKQILFNTDMVRAILDGRKTVTRRDPFQLPEEFSFLKLKGMEYRHKNTYKSEDYKWKNEKVLTAVFENDGDINYIVPCRYKPGDILYVRETWSKISDWTDVDPAVGLPDGYIYKADWKTGIERPKWHPSIHMPREAVRIFLRVTDVRAEKLQDMNQEDAQKEGCIEKQDPVSKFTSSPLLVFMELWNSTIKPADRAIYGWDANPWVRVIEFELISREEAIN